MMWDGKIKERGKWRLLLRKIGWISFDTVPNHEERMGVTRVRGERSKRRRREDRQTFLFPIKQRVRHRNGVRQRFLTYFTSGDPGKTTGLKLSQEKENQQYKLEMCAEWRTPLILYLWATYYILQNICQFISHSICLEICITGCNLNANNGRMSYLYYLFNFPQEDSPSTFFRGLSLYISNLTN